MRYKKKSLYNELEKRDIFFYLKMILRGYLRKADLLLLNITFQIAYCLRYSSRPRTPFFIFKLSSVNYSNTQKFLYLSRTVSKTTTGDLKKGVAPTPETSLMTNTLQTSGVTSGPRPDLVLRVLRNTTKTPRS